MRLDDRMLAWNAQVTGFNSQHTHTQNNRVKQTRRKNAKLRQTNVITLRARDTVRSHRK